MARVVGIDLGTTHTVVAWADPDDPAARAPRVFPIPQRVAAREVEARPLLASCLYAPLPGETDEVPWTIGAYARARGAEVPGRLVASHKSWLSHGAVDRTAPILPWGRAEDDGDDVPRLSPVEAATRVLAHVRRTWDDAHPTAPLHAQDVVLTVPASFDEVARELTLEAAARAGLTVRLLEEPTAAFHDWLRGAGAAALGEVLGADDDALVLVVDVGGGTTDLSLLRVRRTTDAPAVERIAVGRHLLLGGDNMDLALAYACEARLVAPPARLDPARFGQLVVACRAAKERILSGEAEEARVAVLAPGARLVGGTLATTVDRAEVEARVLAPFFPAAPRDAVPERPRAGLVAQGLPYERDVAITRHVAHFFARHAPPGAHLRAVLLNGGVFKARAVGERVLDALQGWGGPPLAALEQGDPDLAVARGAVAHGLARLGHGLRVGGGAARGYYLGVHDAAAARAVCVVPRGAEPGVPHEVTALADGRRLALVVGRPVRFDLYASDDARGHVAGDVVEIDEARFQRLPPVATALDAGARGKAEEVPVAVTGEVTEVGTLELACVERTAAGGGAPRRFRLAFQLRADAPKVESAPPPASLPSGKLEPALALVRAAFAAPPNERAVKDLVRELERVLGERAAWTTETSRALADALLPLRAGRRASADHERVFWLLAGYTLRPGFGAPGDAERTARLSGIFLEKVTHDAGPRVWQQFWIAWRRVAGGLDEAAQVALRDAVDPFLAPPEAGLRRSKKWRPDALEDLLEMATSLERVPAARRAALGGWLVERSYVALDARLFAQLGRVGARVPAYASAHYAVPPVHVERWLDALLRSKWDGVATAATAATQMARLTGDRAMDLGPRVRADVERRLLALGKPELARAVREVIPVEEAERAAFYGESLPAGLVLR